MQAFPTAVFILIALKVLLVILKVLAYLGLRASGEPAAGRPVALQSADIRLHTHRHPLACKPTPWLHFFPHWCLRVLKPVCLSNVGKSW